MNPAFCKYICTQVCILQVTDETLQDIEQNVTKLVEQLLLKVTKKDVFFKTKKLFPTGSFYEGTKIRSPDEFDFMVVLDHTVFTESITLDSKCNTSPWFKNINVKNPKKHVVVTETTQLKPPWSAENIFWKEIQNIIEHDPVKMETNYGELQTKSVKYHKLFLDYKKKLLLNPNNGSNALVHKNQIEIGVDLMLAFEHPQPKDILENEGFPKKEYTQLLLEKGCHLVAKSCHQINKQINGSKYNTGRCDCWFISFAAMETKMMNDLDFDHKKCYQCLKAILIGSVNYPGKCMNLSSYMLKNAFLNHCYIDTCKSYKLSVCVSQILNYLKTGFQNVKMPCFFARDLNVWGTVVVAPVLSEFTHMSQKKPAVHSMLWVEFWRRVVLVFENLLLKTVNQKDQWGRQLVKTDCLRTLTTFMLEEYYKSKQGESFLLQGDQVVIAPFERVPLMVTILIQNYIKEWQKLYKCENFDIEELVKVEGFCGSSKNFASNLNKAIDDVKEKTISRLPNVFSDN